MIIGAAAASVAEKHVLGQKTKTPRLKADLLGHLAADAGLRAFVAFPMSRRQRVFTDGEEPPPEEKAPTPALHDRPDGLVN